MTTPDIAGLCKRLRHEPGDCPFCGEDPYHYVDIGVGMQRVAVVCCGEGIALFQHGDPVLLAQVLLRTEAADALERQAAETERLRGALQEFSREYDGFLDGDGHPCPTLARARAALTGEDTATLSLSGKTQTDARTRGDECTS